MKEKLAKETAMCLNRQMKENQSTDRFEARDSWDEYNDSMDDSETSWEVVLIDIRLHCVKMAQAYKDYLEMVDNKAIYVITSKEFMKMTLSTRHEIIAMCRES